MLTFPWVLGACATRPATGGSATASPAAVNSASDSTPASRAEPAAAGAGAGAQPVGKWEPIFNGANLQGWVPKISGYPLGENYNDTFRAEDGKLVVSYDRYSEFNEAFGHLFYHERLSHYRIRLQYRFVGEQVGGAPHWGARNNGILVHSQAPDSMRLSQWFPVSVESRLVGGLGKGERRTGSMCSPGTHVVMNGKLVTEHCVDSVAPTLEGDGWVETEVEVCGSERIRHKVNGQVVLELSQPQLDDGDEDGRRLIQGADRLLREGYIALQAESQPTEFRNIELMRLATCPQ